MAARCELSFTTDAGQEYAGELPSESCAALWFELLQKNPGVKCIKVTLRFERETAELPSDGQGRP